MIKTKYLLKRGKYFYYYRRIPVRLSKITERRFIITSLNTRNINVAVSKVSYINGLVEKEWASLELLSLESKSYTLGSDKNYQQHLKLSDAAELYVKSREKNRSHTFKKEVLQCVNKTTFIIKDLPINKYSKRDFLYFRDYLISQNKSNSTVRKYFSRLKSIFNFAIQELTLQMTNPVDNIYIDSANNINHRKPIPDSLVLDLQKYCIKYITNELCSLILLISDTGMRLSEAYGLEMSDISSKDGQLCLDVKRNSHRGLKTKYSQREIPLVGASLISAKHILANSKSIHCFPLLKTKYAINSSKISFKCNEIIRKLCGDEYSTHSLRHSLRDRLRQVDAPNELIDEIGGWSTKSVGQNYGLGYTLTKKSNYMDKINLLNK